MGKFSNQKRVDSSVFKNYFKQKSVENYTKIIFNKKITILKKYPSYGALKS